MYTQPSDHQNDEEPSALSKFFFYFIIVLPLLLVLYGWILVRLWDWFIISSFPSVPPLTLAPAIGICLIGKLLAGVGGIILVMGFAVHAIAY